MNIDRAAHSAAHNYKLLTNIVVPRPIAWVTSTGAGGLVNLAPFSFFNAIGADPLLVMLSVAHQDDGTMKHTGRNIVERGEFVVNLVTEDLIAAMNLSAADFPDDESELEAAGLATAASARIAVPRVAAAKAALECRLHSTLPFGTFTVIVGEVVMMHVDDALVGEKDRIHDFFPVGRMGSPAWYCRTDNRFSVPRVDYRDWKAAQD
jgi:flavin reductase (DIM6/NTAB) family NADH-FMN oxidoreductase RutF